VLNVIFFFVPLEMSWDEVKEEYSPFFYLSKYWDFNNSFSFSVLFSDKLSHQIKNRI
jgi:hypothetical protein